MSGGASDAGAEGGNRRLNLQAVVSECGESFTGAVQLANEPVGPIASSVELAYRTEGRGVVDQCAVATLDVSGPGLHVFELAVPAAGPISFEGTLVTVKWEVRLVSSGPAGSEVLETAPATVLPQGGLAVWARDAAEPPS
ncbi:MAG: hypothetical protein ACR2PK_00680 [Acidimicrobiales bacterium]